MACQIWNDSQDLALPRKVRTMALVLRREVIDLSSRALFNILEGFPLTVMVWGFMLGGLQGLCLVGLAVGVSWIRHVSLHRLIRLPDAETRAIEATIKLSQNAGLPAPRVYEDKGIGASSMTAPQGVAVLIVTSATRLLPIRELGAVIAHELAHIRNRDSLVRTVLMTVGGITGALFIFLGLENWCLPLVLLSFVTASWLMEFRCDREGANICGDPLALGSYLRRMKSKVILHILIFSLLLSFWFMVEAYSLASRPEGQDYSTIIAFSLAFGAAFTFPSHPPVFLRVWRLRKLVARLT